VKHSAALILVFLLGLAAGAQDRADVDQLIRQLSDDDWDVREAAGKKLLEAGEDARDALTAAAESEDPDLATRATVLLRELDPMIKARSWPKSRDHVVYSIRQSPSPRYGDFRNYPFLFRLHGDGTLLYRGRPDRGNRPTLLMVALTEEETRAILVELFRNKFTEIDTDAFAKFVQGNDSAFTGEGWHVEIHTDTVNYSRTISQVATKYAAQKTEDAELVYMLLSSVHQYRNEDAKQYDQDADPMGLMEREWPADLWDAVRFVTGNEDVPAREDLDAFLKDNDEIHEEARKVLKNGVPLDKVPDPIKNQPNVPIRRKDDR
jgi:hypothetical protein